jgi:uncharacterized protein (TIGR04222 family)
VNGTIAMTATWGIPGPLFLALWIPLAVVTLLVPRLVLITARWGPSAPPDQTLTPEQLGALTGGPDRAVAASVAGLVESGRLRVDDGRRLTAVVADGRPAPEDDPALSDLDVAVLRSAGSPTTSRQVIGSIDNWFRANDLDEQLVARGLLRDPAQMRARVRLAWIPFGLVVVLALARLAAGIGRGASISFLVTVLVFAGLAALWAKPRPRSFRVLTPAGRATLAAAREFARQAVRAPVSAPGAPSYGTAMVVGAGVIVALGGLAAFPDPAMAALLVPPGLAGGGGFDGGSSCGSSCGSSSCGSSSSCGGGGGCGG